MLMSILFTEKERYLRLHRNLLSSFELNQDKSFCHALAIKEYSRSSADQVRSAFLYIPGFN